ncbi:MAG TPA: 2-oxo-4-hydroxy-4-carboxy-5-ureidoimidazoline decarboxylase [Bacteroidetes bacterium]|nr:2-oxo-4-hydroxy-4-carboxy-5-ureidoimidazoline decarboxylase [Bacteroidota bacterium]
MAARPYKSKNDLFSKAKKIWFEKCKKKDWLEAFRAHPKIGDIESLAKKYQSTRTLSAREQSGVASASNQTLRALAKGNENYEKKFGYIFIVFATGKSAGEMLNILNNRINNNPEKEILIAMQEQYKITELRLNQWLENIA